MDYTKGRWEAINKGYSYLIERQGIMIGNVFGNNEVAEANAHLIAAAPEMYEALRETITMLKTLGHKHPDDDILWALIKQGQQVLAKAGGKNETIS